MTAKEVKEVIETPELLAVVTALQSLKGTVVPVKVSLNGVTGHVLGRLAYYPGRETRRGWVQSRYEFVLTLPASVVQNTIEGIALDGKATHLRIVAFTISDDTSTSLVASPPDVLGVKNPLSWAKAHVRLIQKAGENPPRDRIAAIKAAGGFLPLPDTK